MKKRFVKKMKHYKVLPKRLTNKFMSHAFGVEDYFSVSYRVKDCVKVYVRDVWGRILIYSLNYYDGRVEHSHGYKMWHDDELYHRRKGMPYTGE